MLAYFEKRSSSASSSNHIGRNVDVNYNLNTSNSNDSSNAKLSTTGSSTNSNGSSGKQIDIDYVDNTSRNSNEDECLYLTPSNTNIIRDTPIKQYTHQQPQQQQQQQQQMQQLNDDTILMEETHEDCVYQVTIKKVYNKQFIQQKSLNGQNGDNGEYKSNGKPNPYGTYRPLTSSFYSYINEPDPTTSSSAAGMPPQSPNTSNRNDGLVYSRVKVKQLKYATLPKFIEHLTNEDTGQLDSNLVQIFLVTYRTFTDTSTALRMLRARYEQILPASLEMTEDVRVEHLKSFRSILHMWLEHYSEDFNEPSDYPNLHELYKFAHKYMPDSDLVQTIRSKFEHFDNVNNSSTSNQSSSHSPLSSMSFSSRYQNGVSNALTSTDIISNQMQTSFTSLSPSSISPVSVSSSSSSTTPKTMQVNHHRRSCSNLVPTNLSNEIANVSSSSSGGAGGSGVGVGGGSTNLNHSKSQSNLLSNNNNSNTNNNNNNNNVKLKDSQNNTFPLNLFTLRKSSSNVNISNNSKEIDLLDANFMSIESVYFAEQLTFIDKCLFPRVCAHLCLGGVWSTRYQKNAKNNQSTDTKSNGNGQTSTSTSTSSGTSSSSSSSSPPPPINNTISVSTNSTPILSDKFSSIGAFIDQFNRVSFVVQATILDNIELKPSERAKIIKKWIEIAQACRSYKNFSSLNAIVQGLNTQCVSRLEKTWNEVPSEYKAQFDELTEMFSEDQNQRIFRNILLKDLEDYSTMFDINNNNNNNSNLDGVNNIYININKNLTVNFNNNHNNHNKNNNLNMNNLNLNSKLEGTAKYADINSGINATLGRKYKENMRKQNKSQLREPLGTIPFLGTFLKDLEYIHAQNPAKNDKGLINIIQKRKEFEIIAQIKLLQQASQLYNLKPNAYFQKWLYKQTTYTEEQNYKFSYLIEPRSETDGGGYLRDYNTPNRKSKSSMNSRSDSVDSINSSPTSNSNALNSSSNKTPSSQSKHNHNKDHSRNSSYGGQDIYENNGQMSKSNTNPTNSPMLNTRNSNNQNGGGGDSQSTNTSSSSNSNGGGGDGYLTIPKYYKNSIASTTPSNLMVKVNMEFSNLTDMNSKTDEQIVASTVVYKRIYIKDSDRTKDVKRAILEKFLLNPDTCDKYTLVQVFNNSNQNENSNSNSSQQQQQNQKELIINDNCNVYYAAKNVPDMQFVLRRRVNTSYSHSNVNLTMHTNGSVHYIPQKSTSSSNGSGGGGGSKVSLSPMFNRANKLAKNLNLTPNKSRNKTPSTNLSSSNSSLSTNGFFDQLPPQSPNHHSNTNKYQQQQQQQQNQTNTNSSSSSSSSCTTNTWKIFKKIS